MKVKTEHNMRKHILIFQIVFVLMVLMVGSCFSADHSNADKEATKEKLVRGKAGFTDDGFFYVYDDKGSKLNHKIPSGWMGDYGDITLDLN
ncbi:MAG: hypothetical protein KJ915_09205, partial [Candidatus Omnitrophica bacterium]|nr:hypothetical protein [Candidatus Omnitrophota bacterium]